MAMLNVLGRMGMRDRTTVHGLCRATVSTWDNETGAARRDVIEACLAHEESNRVRAAYNPGPGSWKKARGSGRPRGGGISSSSVPGSRCQNAPDLPHRPTGPRASCEGRDSGDQATMEDQASLQQVKDLVKSN